METGLVNVRKMVIDLAKHVLTYTAPYARQTAGPDARLGLQGSSHSLQLSGTSLGVGSS